MGRFKAKRGDLAGFVLSNNFCGCCEMARSVKSGGSTLGETEESFRWEMLGFSVKGTNNVGRETSNK